MIANAWCITTHPHIHVNTITNDGKCVLFSAYQSYITLQVISGHIEEYTLSVLIYASLNLRGNKISRELIREIREKNAKSAKFNSREIRKKKWIREIREI